MKTQTEWRKIDGFPNYEVSNMGDVRNVKTDRILKKNNRSTGYQTHSLYDTNRNLITFRVHRLVAKTFLSNPDNLPEVDHINRIKHDNRASNLRWSSRGTNIKNKVANVGVVQHIIDLHNSGYSNETIYELLK